MTLEGINWLRVAGAAVACFVLGMLWYSPLLFAKPWARAMGCDPNDKAKMEAMRKGMAVKFVAAFLCSLAAAFMLSKILWAANVVELPQAIKFGVGVWLGFVATVQLTSTLFGGRKLAVFFIDTAYQLLCYVATAAILVY